MRVMLVEDHELVRHGLMLSLRSKGVEVVAEAENGEQALDVCRQKHIDIALMDIGMPVMDGITATRRMRHDFPEVKIIMLTSHSDREQVLASLAAGADAYCMKDIGVELLHDVMSMVMSGALWLDPAIARIVRQALPDARGENGAPNGEARLNRKKYNTDLTFREKEVLNLLVMGRSNKEIARELDITIHTVKSHVCNIIQKLAVDDRTQAAVKAVQEGLFNASEDA